MEYLHNTYFTHSCGGKTWGREIINAPWGHWWFLSLYGCCRDRDVWWWNVGFPNHLALDWLWAKRTLWIRCRVGGWFFETLLFSILGQSDPGPTDAQNTWMSFDLKEHKIHNNVSLVMGHFSVISVIFGIFCCISHFWRYLWFLQFFVIFDIFCNFGNV